MADFLLTNPVIDTTYEPYIVATGVSEEEYLDKYAAQFCEWIEGTVIKMTPIGIRHDDLSQYLILLFRIYFSFRSVGVLRAAPFVMRISGDLRPEPDLQIILNTHKERITDTFVNGAADICIEIVSPASITHDYVTKFSYYEQAGVPEYWLLDYQRRDALFYRLDETGHYIRQNPDADGNYTTPLLPDFRLHVPTLWQLDLPNAIQLYEAFRHQFSE